MKKILILLTFVAFNGFAFTLPPDSIGVEKNADNTIVLHKVDPKETLYSISRRYKISVDDLKMINPGIEKGITVGQVIKIPYKGKFVTEKTQTVAFDFSHLDKPKAATPAPATQTAPAATSAPKKHTVAPKETLYGIARMYSVPVDDIRKWNNLTGDLKLGQEIYVSNPAVAATAPAPAATPSTTHKESKPVVVSESKPVVTQMGGYEKLTQKGTAETMTESHDETKYLCLHKTANMGTIIQVKNEANGNTVFVRVIGKLPEVAENNGIIIKISAKSAERLGVETKQYPVEISYIP